MTIRCQCKFIDYDKFTSPVGNGDNGGGRHVCGQGLYVKPLYFLLSLSVNLKRL